MSISKNSILDLEMLINTTSGIYDIYQQLYEFDLKSEKGTLEYAKCMAELKRLITITENIEKRLSSNQNELTNIIKYLYEKIGYKFPKNSFGILVIPFKEKNHQVVSRIINHFIKLRADNISQNYSVDAFEDIKVSEDMPEDSVDELKKLSLIMHKYGSTNNIFTFMDISSILICLIDQKFSALSIDERKSLLKIIYEYSFLLENIEKTFLQNNCEIDRTPYLISNNTDIIYASLDEKIRKRIKDKNFDENFDVLINVVISYNDFILCTSNGMASFLHSILFIKALFKLLDEEKIIKYTDRMKLILKELESDVKYSRVCYLINEEFKEYLQDKLVP